MHILLALAGIAAGFFIEWKVFFIVRFFGHIPWAERKFGPGGTYTLWRLIGFACILGGYAMFRNPLGL